MIKALLTRRTRMIYIISLTYGCSFMEGVMASNPRSHTVQLGEVGVYHCWSRCVRRAWLD